jgi:ArsR family transcriptional regulator
LNTLDDTSLDELSVLFKALGHPLRLKILQILAENCSCSSDNGNGFCVWEINDRISLPQPYISKHLKILRDCGILDYTRNGNTVTYQFSTPGIIDKLTGFLDQCRRCCCPPANEQES